MCEGLSDCQIKYITIVIYFSSACLLASLFFLAPARVVAMSTFHIVPEFLILNLTLVPMNCHLTFNFILLSFDGMPFNFLLSICMVLN